MKSKSTFVNAIATFIGALTLLFFIILGTDKEESPAATYIFLILAIVLGITQIVLTILRGDVKKDSFYKFLQSILNIIQIGFYGLALCFFMVARVQWLFNLLSKMDAAEFTALFPVTCAFFVLTIITQVVAGFLPYEETDTPSMKAE